MTETSTVAKIVLGILCFVLIGAAVGLGWSSVEQIHHLRQLERVPQTPISWVIPGEVNLSGRIVADRTLTSPDTKTESVYYRYKVEEKVKDSDGDTTWKTRKDDTRWVDFTLEDDTDGIRVEPASGVDFNLERDSRRREGKMRYTEWRLDPGDEIFVFGSAEHQRGVSRVRFDDEEGSFQPIISDDSALKERQGMAMSSALLFLGGLIALSFALLIFLGFLRVHHSAAYLVVLSTVMILGLCYQGLSMMKMDLEDADDYAERTLESSREFIGQRLERHDIEWSGDFDELGSFGKGGFEGLDDEERRRLDGVRIRAAQAVERTNANLSRFPEVVLGPMWGFERLDPVDLPDEVAERFERRETDFNPTRIGTVWALAGLLLGGLGSVLFTRWGLKSVRTKRLIENLPTTPIEGAVYGLIEIEGDARLDDLQEALNAPLTDRSCVYYSYLEEKKSGDDWKTVRSEEKSIPFYCRDETGGIRVDPEGARFMVSDKVTKKKGKRRYTERVIEPTEDLYILGEAAIDARKHDRLEIKEGDDDLPFIISSFGEREVMLKQAFGAFAVLNCAIAATVAAGLAITGNLLTFGPMVYVATAGFSLSYMFVALLLLYYNDLIFLRRRVDRNWSNIDVALKKRFNLVTDLVETVEGYLSHERELQEALSRTRTAGESKEELEADADELEAAQRVRDQAVAVVEDYPDLRGQELVSKLMDRLVEVENEVALMRDGYNDSVERYNTRIQKFPELFLASLFGFERAKHFETFSSEREAPKIDQLRN